MSRFNESIRGSTKTTNYEGAPAYKLSPELELYSAVVTTSLSGKFYESGDDRLDRIISLIKKVDPLFVAQLAVYAREDMYLRSIPLALTVELAKIHRGDSLVGRLTNRVIQRADEITELLAYYQAANKRNATKKLNKLSKQIQTGLAGVFNKFDEYQFSKYNRAGAVSLKDALFLVHPLAKDGAQQDIFDKIVTNTLKTAYTWETELSKVGQETTEEEREKAKAEKWVTLIKSGKLGYMALLRNLRNILSTTPSKEILGIICTRLADPAQVAKSKQFPFRFLSAYRELETMSDTFGVSQVMEALDKACLASAANIPGFDFDTKIVIATDTSGSMSSTVSERSTVLMQEVGMVLSMLLQTRCEATITGIFGERYKRINLPKDNVLANTHNTNRLSGEVGHSTNGYLVVQDLIDRKVMVDKVMLFTDCQLWNDEDSYSRYFGGSSHKQFNTVWTEYKKLCPQAKLYIFDLQGYGNTPVSVQSGDVYLLAGWSEKVFGILDAIEHGSDAVAEIRKIVI